MRAMGILAPPSRRNRAVTCEQNTDYGSSVAGARVSQTLVMIIAELTSKGAAAVVQLIPCSGRTLVPQCDRGKTRAWRIATTVACAFVWLLRSAAIFEVEGVNGFMLARSSMVDATPWSGRFFTWCANCST